MGRIRINIIISDKDYWTLFDRGARNNYIRHDVAKNLSVFELGNPQHAGLTVEEFRKLLQLFVGEDYLLSRRN